MYLISSKSFQDGLIFGRNMHKGQFFSLFVVNEIFKLFLPKETLLDTTILLTSIFSIEIGPLC